MEEAVEEAGEEAAATLEFLRGHAPFDRMAPEDVGFLAERLRPLAFAAGDAVTHPDAGPAEWFYVLREGRIARQEAEAGAGGDWELGPGDCFPVASLVEHRPVRRVHRAVGDVVCLTMDRAAFDALRARSAEFDAFCTETLAGLLAASHAQLRAEASRALGGDSSLNVALSERPLRAPISVGPEAPVREALEVMSARKVGSMLVVDAAGAPIGIFTLKDLMNRVALPGVALDTPIARVMTPDPLSLPRSAFAFEAAMTMAHAGIQHICVVEDGRLVGVVSERDLFSMQRVGLVNLSKSIARAADVPELARLVGDIRQLVSQMMAQGMKVGQIAQIIALLNDQVGERVITLAVEAAGGPPAPFTWIAFGSEGRQEQTLKTDQDNGILFEAPEGMSDDEARALLLPLADRINVALDACGYTLCPGDIMARNPECCLSAREWRARFRRWTASTTPHNLLNASIFFDFRAIWGPVAPVEQLRDWLLGVTAENALFRRQMAANALRNAPPLGVFRDFRLSGSGEEQNTIDLKVNGATPFVDAARILALASRVGATNTVARFEGVARAGGIDSGDAAAWIDAYDYIRMLRMRLNQEQAAAGLPLGNRVDPERLNELDRRILRESFKEARRVQSKLTLAYQL